MVQWAHASEGSAQGFKSTWQRFIKRPVWKFHRLYLSLISRQIFAIYSLVFMLPERKRRKHERLRDHLIPPPCWYSVEKPSIRRRWSYPRQFLSQLSAPVTNSNVQCHENFDHSRFQMSNKINISSYDIKLQGLHIPNCVWNKWFLHPCSIVSTLNLSRPRSLTLAPFTRILRLKSNLLSSIIEIKVYIHIWNRSPC